MFYKFMRGAIKIYLLFRYKIKVKGMENIPDEGAVIASNHVSNFDALVLVTTHKKKITFLSKAELFESFWGKWFFTNTGMIPVKRGAADVSAVKKSIQILKEGGLLGIFVEGTRIKGEESSQAKSGVAMLSTKAKKPVVPVFIKGNYKTFSTITITYGKPIDLSKVKEGKLTTDDYKELSNMVLETIRGLKEEEIN